MADRKVQTDDVVIWKGPEGPLAGTVLKAQLDHVWLGYGQRRRAALPKVYGVNGSRYTYTSFVWAPLSECTPARG